MGAEAAIEAGTTRESLRQWDSISHLHLILELEAEFHLNLTPSQIEELSSVGDVEYLVTSQNRD